MNLLHIAKRNLREFLETPCNIKTPETGENVTWGIL